MARNRIRVSAWLLALTAAGGTVAWYYRAATVEPRPRVATTVVTRGDVVEQVDATGTLQAVTMVQVGTQVSGTVKALHADFNSAVRKGRVIAELDPSLFQTQVEQARATVVRLEADADRARVQVDDAAAKLRRARELANRSLVSASDLEAADLSHRQAEAALRSAVAQIVQATASLHQAQVNLDHTIITAPIDGIVISRNVDVGQTVAATMQAPTLFVLARDLTAMQVNASVSEADIGRVRPNQTATFRVDAYPGRAFSGVVSQVRLQPVTEQNVVSYVTVIDVANPDQALRPGMTASVSVQVAKAVDVLRVPVSALRLRLSEAVLAAYGQSADAAPPPTREPTVDGRVWVLTADQRLQPVSVQTGVSDGQYVAILNGALAPGTTIVTGIATPGESATPATARSPLLPAGRGRGAGGPPR